MINLIVYGTLMRNCRASLDNPSYGGKFVSTVILPKYKMYSTGWYPAVVPSNDEEDIIYGEIWEVPIESLKYLDAYEGHPTLFKRTEIYPNTYIYLYQESVSYLKRLHDGIWNESKSD